MKRYPKKKFLITIIVLTAVTLVSFVVFTSFSIYRFAKETIILDRYQSDMRALSQTKHAVEKQNQSIRRIAMDLYYNDSIQIILNTEWAATDSQAIKDKMDKINNTTLEIHPFIHSIYFFNSNTNRFYTTDYKEDIFVKDVFLMNVLNRYESVPVLYPLTRKINVSSAQQYETEYVFSYVMYSDLTGYNHQNSMIVLNIRLDYLLDEIKLMALDNHQSDDFLALMTQDGIWFSGNDHAKENPFDYHLTSVFLSSIVTVFHRGDNLGIITENIEGTEYLISFTKIGGTHLTLIKAQPYATVFQNLSKTLYQIIVVTMLAVVLAIMASIALSSRIYMPIRRLMKIVDENMDKEEYSDNNEIDYLKHAYTNTMKELRELQTRQFVASDLRKQSLGIRLFQGIIDSETLQGALDQQVFDVDIHSPFYLWVVKIDHYHRLSDMDNRSYNLNKYAIGHFMREILSKRYRNEIFELEADCYYVLLNPDSAADNLFKDFEEVIWEIQQTVQNHLDLTVSFSVSEEIKEYTELSKQYQHTTQNMQYRIVYGSACVIYPSMVEHNNSNKHYKYPFSLEEALLQHIKHGDCAEAELSIDLLLLEINKMDYHSIVISILRLFNRVYDALTELYENSFIPVSDTLEVIGVRYLENHTIMHFRSMLKHEIQKAVAAMQEKGIQSKKDKVYQAIVSIIKNHYQEPSFCITTISDMLDKAQSYLNGVYKEATGTSIAQSLLEIRLNKAAERILTTEDTIGKIICATGFVNESSFYKNFKRQFGMTPNNYKLKHKVNACIQKEEALSEIALPE